MSRGGGERRPAALITGASRGIGRATALGAARAGYDVCVNYVRDRKAGEDVAASCRALGAQAIAVQGDVADRSAVADLFRAADEALGPLRLLVNNAGIIGKTSLVSALDPESLHRTFEVNVYGTIYCTQEAIPRMSRENGGSGGSIVNLSSIAATLGSPGEYVHYAASKGAVETFTIGLAKEVATLGIRVNAVQAGTTDTEIHARAGNPDRPAMVAKTAPLGRVATPDDIARAILWLASDEADTPPASASASAAGSEWRGMTTSWTCDEPHPEGRYLINGDRRWLDCLGIHRCGHSTGLAFDRSLRPYRYEPAYPSISRLFLRRRPKPTEVAMPLK